MIFCAGLDAVAAKFSVDKGRAAHVSVGLTVRFLKNLNVDRRLLAALVEAQLIIERDNGGKTALKQRQERDILNSVTVSLLMEEGMKLEDALKKIHDRDPDAAKKLKVFRNNLMKSTSKASKVARDNYHQLKKNFKELVPKETAKRALRASLAMSGKKG